MSHEVLIIRRQSILLFFAYPGRADLRSIVVNELTTTVLLRPALPGFARNDKILCLLVIRTSWDI